MRILLESPIIAYNKMTLYNDVQWCPLHWLRDSLEHEEDEETVISLRRVVVETKTRAKRENLIHEVTEAHRLLSWWCCSVTITNLLRSLSYELKRWENKTAVFVSAIDPTEPVYCLFLRKKTRLFRKQ